VYDFGHLLTCGLGEFGCVVGDRGIGFVVGGAEELAIRAPVWNTNDLPTPIGEGLVVRLGFRVDLEVTERLTA
jgi:hypothetical protein